MPMCIQSLPDAHAWTRDDWQTNSPRETLVTLRIVVLEADLEFDSLEEVSFLGLVGVFQETLRVWLEGELLLRDVAGLLARWYALRRL